MSDNSTPSTPAAPAAPAAPATTTASTATAPAVTAAPVPPNPVLPDGVRLYECMWVVDANTGREDYNKVITALKEIVEKGGGSWINADKWEERRLAYQIKKRKRGLYIINHFSAPTENVTKIDRNARLSDVVLRHMITIDEDGLTTSPPVRTLDDDDFGGGFGGGGGGGGERRFFGGGGGGGGDRGSRGPRPSGGGGSSGPRH
jgi:small subunit ribosomal protein S6